MEDLDGTVVMDLRASDVDRVRVDTVAMVAEDAGAVIVGGEGVLGARLARAAAKTRSAWRRR